MDAELQRRAKDSKPKKVDADTGAVGKISDARFKAAQDYTAQLRADLLPDEPEPIDLRAALLKVQAEDFDTALNKAADRSLKPHPDGGFYAPFPHDPQGRVEVALHREDPGAGRLGLGLR